MKKNLSCFFVLFIIVGSLFAVYVKRRYLHTQKDYVFPHTMQ